MNRALTPHQACVLVLGGIEHGHIPDVIVAPHGNHDAAAPLSAVLRAALIAWRRPAPPPAAETPAA